MKLLMVFILVAVGLIPSFGFTNTASEIRIQYTHIHDHDESHDHDHESEKHTHELVISSAVSTFIETRSHLFFALGPSLQPFPEAKEEKMILNHYLNTIFRPPITA